jgi:hypothetical protein
LSLAIACDLLLGFFSILTLLALINEQTPFVCKGSSLYEQRQQQSHDYIFYLCNLIDGGMTYSGF